MKEAVAYAESAGPGAGRKSSRAKQKELFDA
jgi:hypothetical protein